MSAHSHDDHHMTGPKPVAFTVPFILAAVTLLILFMFLSLCDPKPHHAGSHHETHGTEAAGHHEAVEAAGAQDAGHAAEAPEAANSSEPEAHH